MRSVFPLATHTYLALAYFAIHLGSIYIHDKWMYMGYEVLFFLMVFFGVRYARSQGVARGVILQSATLHGILTAFYLPELFVSQGVSLNNPLAALALYPLVHWLLSSGIYWVSTRKVRATV